MVHTRQRTIGLRKTRKVPRNKSKFIQNMDEGAQHEFKNLSLENWETISLSSALQVHP